MENFLIQKEKEELFKKKMCYCATFLMWGATSFLFFSIGYHYEAIQCG